MADATLEYNFQQLHGAVLAQQALADQLQATIAQQRAQVAELRTRLDALAHQARVTLALPPPPASAVVVEPLPEPSAQPRPVETPERSDHVSTHTTPTLPPERSVPRALSRSSPGRKSGEAEE